MTVSENMWIIFAAMTEVLFINMLLEIKCTETKVFLACTLRGFV